ncbi:DUF4292 domain-containing protein [Flavobacterium sp.]|jgi:hypothetical protein|uniref:DUF4292 domain-containing protein n=1 Tax=Flavobacterium sp. TaxID=239 RepID=UPI0037BF9891
MKKSVFALALVFILVGCKAKKGLVEANASDDLATQNIIQNHYDVKKDFSTAYIRANAKYKDKNQSLSFSAEIRIKKNEMILVSIRFLGITMAKGLITPTEVKYYEKNGGKFFEGDYTTLSNWLGTDLDFYKVQNMLIGQAMDDLRKGKYANTIENKLYKLKDINDKQNVKSFYFEASNFLIKRQEIEQVAKNRKLNVYYPNHKEYAEAILPLNILIEASQENEKNTISLDYNSVTFNEELSFPYSVPSDYEQIFIEN